MPNRKTQQRIIYAIFGFTYLLCTLFAMSSFLQNSALGDAFPRVRFDAMVNGTAYKPFVYRQLVPMTVRAVDQVTPAALREAASRALDALKFSNDFSGLRAFMPWLDKTFPASDSHYRRLLACVLLSGFWCVYMLMIFRLAQVLFPAARAVALFAPVVATLAFTSFSYQWQFIYDIPCLALSAACFYFLYTERYRAYLICFLLAAVNKETSLFILLFFSLWHWRRLEEKKIAIVWLVQCAIYLLVKISISTYYMGNAGFFLEENMRHVLEADILAQSTLSRILAVAGLWFFLTFGWNEKPLYLKYGLAVFPAMYASYFFYGFGGEYRVFFDLHPLLTLLLAHTLVVKTGIADADVFRTEVR